MHLSNSGLGTFRVPTKKVELYADIAYFEHWRPERNQRAQYSQILKRRKYHSHRSKPLFLNIYSSICIQVKVLYLDHITFEFFFEFFAFVIIFYRVESHLIILFVLLRKIRLNIFIPLTVD